MTEATKKSQPEPRLYVVEGTGRMIWGRSNIQVMSYLASDSIRVATQREVVAAMEKKVVFEDASK